MLRKVKIIAVLAITAAMLNGGTVQAVPANAISNELKATIEVLPGETSVAFDMTTMCMDPGYNQAGSYVYRNTVYDWLNAHLVSALVEGEAVPAGQIEFITFEDGSDSMVQWQGYNITGADEVIITDQGQIGDNLTVTGTATATVTITALCYNGQIDELDEAVNIGIEVNPYFTGNIEELGPDQAKVNAAETSLNITGLTSGGSLFSLPPAAAVFRLYQPVAGLTPEAAGLSPTMYLTGENEVMSGPTCKVNKRWPSGQHDIYIVNGPSVYHLALRIDHLSHDSAKALSYLKAADTELVINAVHLGWANGPGDFPVQNTICGQTLNLPIRIWATEPLAVKLVAVWSGGTVAYDVDLASGDNPEINFPVTFSQAGIIDLTIYTELR